MPDPTGQTAARAAELPISARNGSRHFAPTQLARELETRCPHVDCAFLLGSAQDGTVRPGSDVDVAVGFAPRSRVSWDGIAAVATVVEACVPGTTAHVGILDSAGLVYRFEALRGRRLFVRPQALEAFAEFASLTCREHESYRARLEHWAAVRRTAQPR